MTHRYICLAMYMLYQGGMMRFSEFEDEFVEPVDDTNIYASKCVERLLDNDELSFAEAAFMMGYEEDS